MSDNSLALRGQSVIKNVEDVERIATSMAKSGYFQDSREMAQAVVKIMAGQEMGFGPFASMTGVYIISGRPSVSANLMASAVKGSGKYDYRVISMTDSVCELAFFQGKDEIGRSRFTAEDAKRAGTKNMDRFPKNMLFARAMSNGVRWYCPDVFSGAPTYTPEELGADVNESGDVIPGSFIEVTPPNISTQTNIRSTQTNTAPQEAQIIRELTGEAPMTKAAPTNGNGHAPAAVAPKTASSKDGEYADMDIPALAGRHTHYLKAAKDKDATEEERAEAKATAAYIETLIKAKRDAITNNNQP